MLQRLKYALANLLPWSILFFDEPFSGLDIEGKNLALACLNTCKANDRKMQFVTNDVEWGLSFCNRLFLFAAGALKMLDQVIKDTVEYTSQRKAFGKSILDNQVVHFRLAELQTEVELLRALVYSAT